jgi:central glycolytic genes regulator
MNLLELEKKIVPEILEIMEKRYIILRTIYYNQPIGRRTLANNLGLGERTIRTEVNFLKNQGLLNVETMGMYVTKEGKDVLANLGSVIHEFKGISQLEKTLEKMLNVEKVIILPGNSAEDGLVLKDMGKITSASLKKIIKDNCIIGITGGNTMASVAEEMIPSKIADNVLVIPARGGLGKDVETQANSIAAKLAQKLGGNYKLLHVPDSLEKEALEVIRKIEDVKESIDFINKMNILVFGIGRADTMAERRNLPKEKIDALTKDGAVAEAFGHYFDIKGREIWEYLTVGLTIEKYKEIDYVIGVAGGEEKAEAIIAVSSLRKKMTIVTDEEAAKKIIEIVSKAT